MSGERVNIDYASTTNHPVESFRSCADRSKQPTDLQMLSAYKLASIVGANLNASFRPERMDKSLAFVIFNDFWNNLLF